MTDVYDSNDSDTTSNEASDDLKVSKLTHYPDVITASYIGVVVLLGVLTNGAVCYVYLRLMTGSVVNRPFQPFIVTMSSADLLCCLFGFPIEMFVILTPWAPSHLKLWVFSSVIISVCTTLDVFMLVALNTIRYFSVMYPSRTIGRKAIITAMVATLMMSCVINVPFTFLYGEIMLNLKNDYIFLCERPGLVDHVYFIAQLVLYLIVMTCLLQQDIQMARYISELTKNGRLVTVMSKRLPVSGISHTYIFGSARPGAYLINKKRKTNDVYRVSSRQRLIASFHRDRKNSKNLQSSPSPTCSFVNTSSNNKSAEKENDKKENKDKSKEKKRKVGFAETKVEEPQSRSRKIAIPIIGFLIGSPQVKVQDTNVVQRSPPTARSLRSFQQMWEESRHASSLTILKLPAGRRSSFRVMRKNVKDKTLLSLGITTAVFFVSYTPFLVLLVMCHNRMLIHTNNIKLSALGILQRSTYILTAFNAIIYNIFNEGFWQRLRLYRKRLLRRLCCKG